MLHDVKDYFYFTRSEKRGIFVLSLLIILSFFLPAVYSFMYKPQQEKEIEAMIAAGIVFIPGFPEADSDTVARRHYAWQEDVPQGQSGKDFGWPKFTGNGNTSPIIELNSADSLDLLSLPGIGPYFAKSIIRYREKLGGYLSVNQLLEIYGMDRQKLDRLKSRLSVDTAGLKKLGVNTADFKTLMRHPYCNFQVSKALVKFRQKYGTITRFDELLKSGIMPDSVYAKILPYLTLE